jgi:PsbP
MKHVTLSLLLSSLSLYGQCAQAQSWKSLKENGYSIQYPADWDLDKSGLMGMSFMVLSKQTSSQDRFKENVNLIMQDLTGLNLDLAQYAKISEDQVKSMIANAKILESKQLSTNNKPYHKVIYTGDQGVYKLKFEQYYWVVNNKAYVLTFTCEIDQFDNYRVTGEKILNSFNFN